MSKNHLGTVINPYLKSLSQTKRRFSDLVLLNKR